MGSWKQTLKIGIAASILFAIGIVTLPHKASAQYVENNLIDDNLFLDAASMDQGYIQSFLNARGGYLAGYNAWSDRDNASVPAARIIADAAYDYGISPKVILATLQKEQSLVTDPSPSQSQLNFAMGYGCGDSSGCSSYSGFYHQVDNATWQLRYNMERARGNNTWWRVSSSYPCGGSTRYYSPGLYQGNTVTFYDDSGYGYKTFKLMDAATAALYCYTPHAYPGSPGQYYSGSYNFVLIYESWFGSTQPTVVIGSRLFVGASWSKAPRMFTNTPITAYFELANNTASPIDVGSMSVAVRDSSGGNHDFQLEHIVVPAYGRASYSATQTFSTEDTYTFWITNYSGGSWKDNYPVSWDIDAPRQATSFVQAMPTISIGPNTGTTDKRQFKSMTYAFAVQNNSASTLDAGKMALAVRGPGGLVSDMPLKAVSIPANSSYTYTDTLNVPYYGSYTAWVTETPDGGRTWYENSFPASGAGVNRRITFDVKPSPTLTQSPTLNVGSPRVGQPVNASFIVHNYGDASVNAGILGLAIRDPQGRNVDAGGAAVTVNSGADYTYQATNLTFNTPGAYTAWVTGSRDGGRTWDDNIYPALESNAIVRKVTFTVLPNPTITVQPTVSTTDPRVGKGLAMTFTLKNYTAQDVSAGKLAIALRDPQGRNIDLALKDVLVPANGTYVYTDTQIGSAIKTPGTYTAWITRTTDLRNWDDTTYPALDSNALQRKITFSVSPSPTLTLGPTLSIASPHVNEAVNASFKVKNYGDTTVDAGILGLAIRDPQGRNVDAGGAVVTINANSEYTFSATGLHFTTAGTYTAWVTNSRDGGKSWDDSIFPTLESNSVIRRITFTVQP